MGEPTGNFIRNANGVRSVNVKKDSTSATKLCCTNCNKEVAGGTYISGVFYCPMCYSVIVANLSKGEKQISNISVPSIDMLPDACKCCSNHPSNGGTGICHCTIPYFSKPGYPQVNTITTTNSTPYNQRISNNTYAEDRRNSKVYLRRFYSVKLD